MNFKKYKSSKGFTLIELLVVISIISLISSIVLAAVNEARAKARDARRLSDMRQINTALQLYLQDHNEAPLHSGNPESAIYSTDGEWKSLENTLANYIGSLPVDPLNGTPKPSDNWDVFGSETYRYSYRRLDYHSQTCKSYYSPNCFDSRTYILDTAFEKRSKVGNLPISAQFFGLTYEGW